MIIPVFDVKDGVSVSGKSGRRSTYTPLESIYGTDILDMAGNLRSCGAGLVYIADLDKLEGVGDNSGLIGEVNQVIPVMLDNGASSLDDIREMKNICTYPILATESINDIGQVEEIFESSLHDNIILSIDLKDNELLIKDNNILLEDILDLVNRYRPGYTILLNISKVGTQKGNNDPLIRQLIQKTPYTQHIIAGGLTNDSITQYKKEGIDNFLIGTILHNGKLSDEHIW